ncbi:MAG: hypothetical protein QW728_05885, partial [Thermoplasmata archaeon]
RNAPLKERSATGDWNNTGKRGKGSIAGGVLPSLIVGLSITILAFGAGIMLSSVIAFSVLYSAGTFFALIISDIAGAPEGGWRKELETYRKELGEYTSLQHEKDSLRLLETSAVTLENIKTSYVKSRDKLAEARSLLADAKNFYFNVGAQDTMMADAQAQFIAGNYETVSSLCVIIIDECTRLIREHDEALEAVSKANSAVEGAKAEGAVVKDAEKLFEDAVTAMSAYEYVKAAELAAKSKQSAEMVMKSFTEARTTIKKAREELEITKRIGADISRVEDALAKAELAMEDCDYEGANESAKNAIALAREVTEIYRKTIDIISRANEMVEDLIKRNIRTKKASELIAQAREAMRTDIIERTADYDKATQLANEAISVMEEDSTLYKEVELKRKRLEEQIAASKKEGIFVAPVETLYDSILKLMSEEKYEEAGEKIEAANRLNETQRRLFTEANESLDKNGLFIVEIKESGIDTTRADEIMDAARKAMKLHNYAHVKELCEKAVNEAKEIKTLYENTAGAISTATSKIANAENQGIFVDEIRSTLENSKRYLSKNDYAKAYQLATQAIADLEKQISIYNEATEIVNKAKSEVAVSGDIKLEAGELNKLLEDVEVLYRNHNYMLAIKNAKAILDGLKESRQAMQLLNDCKKRINALEQAQMDVTKLKNVLWLAESFMKKGQASKVITYTQKLEKLIEALEVKLHPETKPPPGPSDDEPPPPV